MFNQDITIINKYNEGYIVNHVKGFWSSDKGVVISNIGLVKNDGVIVRILKSESGYHDPNGYTGVGWTLRNDDYICKGKVTGAVTKIADVKQNYQCMKITNVAVKDYGSEDMQHYEVSGQ